MSYRDPNRRASYARPPPGGAPFRIFNFPPSMANPPQHLGSGGNFRPGNQNPFGAIGPLSGRPGAWVGGPRPMRPAGGPTYFALNGGGAGGGPGRGRISGQGGYGGIGGGNGGGVFGRRPGFGRGFR